MHFTSPHACYMSLLSPEPTEYEIRVLNIWFWHFSLFLCIPLLLHFLLLEVISLLFKNKVTSCFNFGPFITVCINRFTTMRSRK
jgi:hypothetical protein